MVGDMLKKFELNNSALEEFDSLMSKHLDQIEELVVCNIDTKSKLLNIVRLCINIKTLIIEGDEFTNVNSIISNVCNPELLQNLILNGVKIPSNFAFKKLTSLKMISLNNIRACSAKAALDVIVNPERIEALNFEQVDFAKSSIDCIKKFENLKYLNLIEVRNCKLNNLDFLSEMTRLERINIEKNTTDFCEINNIIKCAFNKQIQVDLPTLQNERIINSLEIEDSGKVFLTINNNQFEELMQNLNPAKIDDIIIIVSNHSKIINYIDYLRQVKGNVSIAVKDVSCLSSQDAKILKDELQIKNINVIDFDGTLQYEKNKYCYAVDNYIKIREELDRLLNEIDFSSDELLKFLQIYKVLGESIVYDDFFEEELLDYSTKNEVKSSNLENGLLYKKSIDSGFSEILKNSLACFDIDSKIIRGNLIGTQNEHVWNQVKILDKWYNVDLGLDSKRINNSRSRKLKPIYCLIDDKTFGKTHIPNVSNVEYCPETIDRKIISTFFKRSFSLRLYAKFIIEKIKKIFNFNSQIALPEGKHKHEK